MTLNLQIPWNKGLKGYRKGFKASPETIEKLRISHLGKKPSDETRKKLSESKKGKNNPAWKGGIVTLEKLERNKFRNTMQKQVFERDNYTCQICGTRGVALQVDHIQSWKDYVNLRFSMDNCRTLCMDCHYLITWGRPKSKEIKT